MATFSTVVFSFCQRECGFALGTILGMFVILPVRTIFRRFYSGYVAHYDDMWVCVRVHVWCGCVVLVAVAGKLMLKYNCRHSTAAQNITPCLGTTCCGATAINSRRRSKWNGQNRVCIRPWLYRCPLTYLWEKMCTFYISSVFPHHPESV